MKSLYDSSMSKFSFRFFGLQLIVNGMSGNSENVLSTAEEESELTQEQNQLKKCTEDIVTLMET